MAKTKAHPALADERRSVRASVMLAATVECAGEQVPVRVVNLSAHGALVQGEALPDGEVPMTFRCGGLDVPGWIAWVRPPLGGINFDRRVDPNAALQTVRGAQLVVRDTRPSDFRRPGFRGNQLNDEERRIVEKWTREQEGSAGN